MLTRWVRAVVNYADIANKIKINNDKVEELKNLEHDLSQKNEQLQTIISTIKQRNETYKEVKKSANAQ